MKRERRNYRAPVSRRIILGEESDLMVGNSLKMDNTFDNSEQGGGNYIGDNDTPWDGDEQSSKAPFRTPWD